MLRTFGIAVLAILVGSAVVWADTAYMGPPDGRLPPTMPAYAGPLDGRLPPTTPAYMGPPGAPLPPSTLPYGLAPYDSGDVEEPSCAAVSSTPQAIWNQHFCGPACCDSPCQDWSIQADALWLQRSFGSGLNVGQTIVAPGGPAVDTLNAKDTAFKLRPGMRLALSMRVNDQISWQVVYFGLQSWSGSSTILADAGSGIVATSPYTQADKVLGGFDTSLGYTYRSHLHNVELNRIGLLADNGAWSLRTLSGFRYFQWNESFTLTGVDQFFGVTENVNSSSNNYLVGGQLGGDVRRTWNQFRLDLTGKAGLFANFVQQSQSNLSSTGTAGLPAPGVVPISTFRRTAGAAGVLDFSAIATYQFRPHFAVRGGYQLLFVDGLALAPNQLAGPSHNSDVFLHGPTVGLEHTW